MQISYSTSHQALLNQYFIFSKCEYSCNIKDVEFLVDDIVETSVIPYLVMDMRNAVTSYSSLKCTFNNIKLIIQDARDYHAVSKIYNDINPDIIINLAAVSHANKSNKDPFSTFDHSMRTLENVLDAIRSQKTHLIYFTR